MRMKRRIRCIHFSIYIRRSEYIFFFWQLGKEWGSLSKISYISNINAFLYADRGNIGKTEGIQG